MNQKQADSHRHRKWHDTHSHTHVHTAAHTHTNCCTHTLTICFLSRLFYLLCGPIGARSGAAYQVAPLERDRKRERGVQRGYTKSLALNIPMKYAAKIEFTVVVPKMASASSFDERCEQFDLCAFEAICWVNSKENSILINFPHSLQLSLLLFIFPSLSLSFLWSAN